MDFDPTSKATKPPWASALFGMKSGAEAQVISAIRASERWPELLDNSMYWPNRVLDQVIIDFSR